ncbi:hypothetical protein AC578_802 [Pseudocercospora eumusae]|uniref:Secreted protein n=1 Tax=Pseudocercospora eumusae TaxID=321146 RepID=A0A139HC07_9PEZI|nr:hypothetical protein AC578_802 [Pseudocercospora eumusae]
MLIQLAKNLSLYFLCSSIMLCLRLPVVLHTDHLCIIDDEAASLQMPSLVHGISSSTPSFSALSGLSVSIRVHRVERVLTFLGSTDVFGRLSSQTEITLGGSGP